MTANKHNTMEVEEALMFFMKKINMCLCLLFYCTCVFIVNKLSDGLHATVCSLGLIHIRCAGTALGGLAQRRPSTRHLVPCEGTSHHCVACMHTVLAFSAAGCDANKLHCVNGN